MSRSAKHLVLSGKLFDPRLVSGTDLFPGFPTRPARSPIPIFLLPICTQHRTFISRLLSGVRGRKPHRYTSPAPKPKANDEESLPQTGKLAPGSIFDKAPKITAEPETTIQEGIPDEVDTEQKQKSWAQFSPVAQISLIQQARARGWKGPSPDQKIPPLSVLQKAKKNQDSLSPADLSKLKQRIIAHVRRRGRLTKQEMITRSERSLMERSPHIKTSVKKIGPLARQIAGKKIEDAMVQMRFSKKKAAAGVLKHLEYARNKAMVDEEMGLGLPEKAIKAAEDVVEGKDKEEVKLLAEERRGKGEPEEVVIVRDRDGKKRVIDDRSQIYIDQAWVGRGKWDYDTDYRARGNAYRLYKPYTSESNASVLSRDYADHE